MSVNSNITEHPREQKSSYLAMAAATGIKCQFLTEGLPCAIDWCPPQWEWERVTNFVNVSSNQHYLKVDGEEGSIYLKQAHCDMHWTLRPAKPAGHFAVWLARCDTDDPRQCQFVVVMENVDRGCLRIFAYSTRQASEASKAQNLTDSTSAVTSDTFGDAIGQSATGHLRRTFSGMRDEGSFSTGKSSSSCSMM